MGLRSGLSLLAAAALLWACTAAWQGRHPDWSAEGQRDRLRLATVFWQDLPVGERRQQLHRLDDGRWQLDTALSIAATVRGKPLAFSESETLIFAAAAPHALLTGSWTRQQDGGAAVEGRFINVAAAAAQAGRVTGADAVTEAGSRRLDSDYSLDDWLAASRLAAGQPAPGTETRWRQFHAESGQTREERASVVAVRDDGSVQLAVRRSDEDWQAEWLFRADGEMQRMAWGGAFTLQAAGEGGPLPASGVDLYRHQNVRTDRGIGPARDIVSLSLRWSQVVDLHFARRPGQDVLPGFLRTDARVPGPLAALLEQTQALLAEPRYGAGDERLRQRARQLTDGATGTREQVSRLVHFVAHHLRDDDQLQSRSAGEILSDGYGDCTEHSQLFVALARAAGIPAREVSGLVYLGDSERRFGGHTWAEVVIDGRWQMVDPMWDLLQITGTHLRMAGDGQGAVAAAQVPPDLQFSVEAVLYGPGSVLP